MIEYLAGAATGWILCSAAVLWMERRRRRRAAVEAARLRQQRPPDATASSPWPGGPPRPPVPDDGGLHPVMEQALANAPELFRKARMGQAIQDAIRCTDDDCDEPTMLICERCGARYCVGHLMRHEEGCVAVPEAGRGGPP